jgi:hypothetical protein
MRFSAIYLQRMDWEVMDLGSVHQTALEQGPCSFENLGKDLAAAFVKASPVLHLRVDWKMS